MKKILFVISLFVGLVLTGCQKAEPGGTATQNLSGDWWVKYEIEVAQGIWEDQSGYSLLQTYNTAANISNEMWIDDHGFWGYEKIKITTADPANYSFATTTDSVRSISFWDKTKPAYSVWVKVSSGKVYKQAVLSPSGVKTDSICFYIDYQDDGTLYRVSGYKKTGYHEDDH